MLMQRALQPILFSKPNGIDGYTKLLVRGYGADASTLFTDASQYRRALTTGGNAQVDTAISKFGRSALLCDGTGDFLTTPDSVDFTLGGQNFTVDFWFNVAGGAGTTRMAFGQNDSGVSAAASSVYGGLTGINVITGVAGRPATATSLTGTTAITATGWHHYAFIRAGSRYLLFLDGVLEAEAVVVENPNDSANLWAVGRRGEQTSVTWNGSIEEFRLSVGIARWMSNFTPPQREYA